MTDLVSTVSALAAALTADERALLLRALAPPRPRVAIVGLGCRFPGGAGPDDFWRLLARGGDAVREVPADRWDSAAYFAPDPDAPGRMLTRYGAFLDRVDQFDAGFFEVSPHEARRMDPQQRLLLAVAWEALEHAGVAPGGLHGSNTGVFVGACSHDYDDLQPRPADAHTLTGGLLSVLSGRLSYHLGLQGPSLTLDTACSSSLVALHLACRSLRDGECDLAIVAGVNLILDPEGSVRLSRMRALSPDGRCRSFDARASGYARGEGVGVLVLRREADALRDHDRIWALVRGSAVNHDGRSPSLTAPNGLSQRDVIRRALADAGLGPDAVDYIEAHGTGTPLGDPIEAETLRELFDRPGRPTACTLGSVKTNIGHLEAAAGLAGVIKTTLALAHESIPAHLHFTQPNPRIDLGDNLHIPTAAHPWPRGPRERIAGVSSFGISGTNAHVLLSEGPPAPAPADDRGPFLLPLSAKTPAALAALARAWSTLLRDPAAPPLAALVRTAALRRAHHPHRLAVVGATHEALAHALDAELADPTEPTTASAPAPDPLTALARRYVAGAAIAWQDLYPGPSAPAPAPTYPWQAERHWFDHLSPRPARPDLSPGPANLSPGTPSTNLSPGTQNLSPGPVPANLSPGPQNLPPEPAPTTLSPGPADLSPGPADLSPAAIAELVLDVIRGVLGLAPDLKIRATQDLRDLGMDSLLALDLATALAQRTGRPIANSFAWDYPTPEAMNHALAALLKGPAA